MPLAKKTMPKPPVDNSSKSDEILYVNVSGIRFQVRRHITRRFKLVSTAFYNFALPQGRVLFIV